MHPYEKDRPTQVVSGYVTCEHVRDALDSIRRHSKPNDLALIYWLGKEAVDDDGRLYLLTSESRPGTKLAQKAIALKEMLNFPRDVPGACVLLLDTAAGPAAGHTGGRYRCRPRGWRCCATPGRRRAGRSPG